MAVEREINNSTDSNLLGSETIFGNSNSFIDPEEDDYGGLVKEINKIKKREQRTLRSPEEEKELYKESFKPKKPVEEHENFEIPYKLKSKLDKVDDNLKQIHKENVALGYSLGMLNETVEKIQSDLVQVATRVEKISKNSMTLYNEDSQEELETYEPKVDEDYIINNVIAKLKENSPVAKKSKFVLTKKDIFLSLILLFLLATNSYFTSLVSKFYNSFNKEVLTVYKVRQGDKAKCFDKNNKEYLFNLKEGESINVNIKGNIKEFVIESNNVSYFCSIVD